MEWVVKLEARSGCGEVETIEVATIKRRVVGLTAEEGGRQNYAPISKLGRDMSAATRNLLLLSPSEINVAVYCLSTAVRTS